MKLHRKDLPRELDSAYVLGVSDLHLGAPQFDEAYLVDLNKWVKATPNAYILINGDLGNMATKDSKSDVYEEKLTPHQQKKKLMEYFADVRDRVLGLTEGNHEHRIRLATSIDICDDLAQFFGCPYGQDGILLHIRLGQDTRHGKTVSYIIYATHGWSMARTPGGKVNMTVSLQSHILADVYFTGHTHSKFIFEGKFLMPDEHNGQVIAKKQLFASTGAILDYGGYAQKKGYPPGAKGIPRLRLDGKRKDVHGSI